MLFGFITSPALSTSRCRETQPSFQFDLKVESDGSSPLEEDYFFCTSNAKISYSPTLHKRGFRVPAVQSMYVMVGQAGGYCIRRVSYRKENQFACAVPGTTYWTYNCLGGRLTDREYHWHFLRNFGKIFVPLGSWTVGMAFGLTDRLCSSRKNVLRTAGREVEGREGLFASLLIFVVPSTLPSHRSTSNQSRFRSWSLCVKEWSSRVVWSRSYSISIKERCNDRRRSCDLWLTNASFSSGDRLSSWRGEWQALQCHMSAQPPKRCRSQPQNEHAIGSILHTTRSSLLFLCRLRI